ncbi:MAG: asparaginase domain-containing protein [Saprospiraceae bacterium]
MVQIFITGGTFDKDYNYISGKLEFGETSVNQMLERGRCTVPHNVRTLMMIDSLEMTDPDREIIAHNVMRCEADHIVVTHGSDTMVKTAAYLAKQDISTKTVILTGAMVPYAFGNSSDGFFNLGSALSFAQVMKPGVYVAMNGQIFTHDNVRKNRKSGYFEFIETN